MVVNGTTKVGGLVIITIAYLPSGLNIQVGAISIYRKGPNTGYLGGSQPGLFGAWNHTINLSKSYVVGGLFPT